MEEILRDKVHHGHNIRRIRQRQGLKQEAMAGLVNLSQQTVSRYETMKEIDEEMLERFAKALKVPVEVLETLEEDATSVTFENITNNNNGNNANSNSGVELDYADNSHNTFNPIEKITELYERLLKEKDEKIKALEEQIATLKQ